VRLKRLREATGKSEQEFAHLLGKSLQDYHEWEAFPGELNAAMSLSEISLLSSALGVPARALFDDGCGDGQPVSPEHLCAKVLDHLISKDISSEEFEDRVGFEIKPYSTDTNKIMDWNVDCLRFVCAEIGVDWRLALP
jgi:transcriptional regulator with XRE-family HTH domain